MRLHPAGRRRADEDEKLRQDHLLATGRLLWPEPAQFVVGSRDSRGSGGEASGAVSEFVLVPSAARPRLLVPSTPRRVAAGAVRRYTSPTAQLARLRLRLLSMMMGAGLAQRLMPARVVVSAPGAGESPPDTIESYLRQMLGVDLHVSLHIGPARANRKPILQLLSPTGETFAFAKIGTNDLTRRLVASEASALEFLNGARLDAAVVPAVLHHGRWHGHEVLVQSALPTWERSAISRPLRLAVLRELAQVRGTWTEPLAGSDYWDRLRRDVRTLSDREIGGALDEALRDLEPLASATVVPMGSWHGDWTPWNMAASGDRVLVWDWERFATGVPLGYDAIHYDLQEAVTGGRRVPPELAVENTLGRSADLLEPVGVAAEHARLVASLYLVEIAVRYLQDGQAEAGARLGRLGHWLLPALVRQARTIRGAGPP